LASDKDMPLDQRIVFVHIGIWSIPCVLPPCWLKHSWNNLTTSRVASIHGHAQPVTKDFDILDFKTVYLHDMYTYFRPQFVFSGLLPRSRGDRSYGPLMIFG
jgi:hypothetical protein